jgi:hypothetical protein
MERPFKNFEISADADGIRIEFSDFIEQIKNNNNLDINVVIWGAKEIAFGLASLIKGELPQKYRDDSYDESFVKYLPWHKEASFDLADKINNIAIEVNKDVEYDWFDIAHGKTGADMKTQVIYQAIYVFRAIDIFFTSISENDLWGALSQSFTMHKFWEALNIHVRDSALKTPREIAAHAVSHREDQVLKPDWQEHVRRCVAQCLPIRNINDLLGYPGYPPVLTKTPSMTLKKWAKEACPELKFKAGRPS